MKTPLVLCITNSVAANFTANVLLAIGAKPAMLDDPDEAEALSRVADAALINVGTVNAHQSEVMRAAVRGAISANKPWVLDPVAVQAPLELRRRLVREFLSAKPTLIRGNREEIAYLNPHGITTLATGETDIITSADGVVTEVTGGNPMLQQVTATGCAQGAICAAFLGRGESPDDAAIHASRLMKRAGELAGEKSPTPGSFATALIDCLYLLTSTSNLHP